MKAGGAGAAALSIGSYPTSWARSPFAGLLPLLALAWLARTRVRIEVDARGGTLASEQRGCSRGAVVECRIDQGVDVLVEETPCARLTARRLAVVLRSGERLPLTRTYFLFTGRGHARAAARLRATLAAAQESPLSG